MSRLFVLTLTVCPGVLLIQQLHANSDVRAAYVFPYAHAYSAAVDKPAYSIVDLGAEVIPLDVTDSMTVLLRSGNGDFVRWSAGQREILSNQPAKHSWASMNENRSVAELAPGDNWYYALTFYPGNGSPSVAIDWTEDLLEYPSFMQPYVLNDMDQLTLRRESQSHLNLSPGHQMRIETNVIDLKTRTWKTIAEYNYILDSDLNLSQGGSMYRIFGFNNYEGTTGYIYIDKAFTSAMSAEIEFSYQYYYYTYDKDIVLTFEPLALNDRGTILGRTEGPLFDLIILDAFGERVIRPALSELGTARPRMSNPVDGFEEIILGSRYFRRMSERDYAGQATGSPAPDFWEGTITDLVTDRGNWSRLEATCISANGRIAGTGRYFDPVTGETSTRGFLLMPNLLVPDWDRDGRIDQGDKAFSAKGLPWRLWVNDDDDAGDVSRSSADDLPDRPDPDHSSPGVDGRRDIVDFFPLHIDLQAILQCFDNLDRVSVRLSQADGALNFVYSFLGPEHAGYIHMYDYSDGYGPGFLEPLHSATTVPVQATPLVLDRDFLDALRNGNHSVLLFEATMPSSAPLVMDFKYDGTTVFSCSLPLSTGPVRDMIRIINLRNSHEKFDNADPGPWLTSTGDPANLPDAYLKEFTFPLKTLVHVHGFNWGGDDIPAAHSEIFKRFHQTGSHARFIGVSWFGDQGTFDLADTSFDYNQNVINAFVTAGILKESLRPFSGYLTYMFAHSLGNMVASSAIVDHSLKVQSYFMINAAVPSEAYLGESPDRRLMVHPEWKDEGSVVIDYAETLLSPNWHRLFSEDDNRRFLKWRERFKVLTDSAFCFNFFSSGEDILRKGNGEVPSLLKHIWNRELIWVYNEMNKGIKTLSATLMGDTHAGWGFNQHYMTWQNLGGGAKPPYGEWVPMSTVKAGEIAPGALIENPFFRPFSSGNSDFPEWGDGQWLYGDTETANRFLPALPLDDPASGILQNHAKILAEALPAHSSATGATELPKIPLLQNFDMDRLYRHDDHWPVRGDKEKEKRWLHSDYLSPAYLYVSAFYYTCTRILKNDPY